MADFEQANNNGALRTAGEWISALGLGIITAVDVVVVHHCVKNEAVSSLMPVVGAGLGAVAVWVALMMSDSPRKE